jgi:L-asparaginase
VARSAEHTGSAGASRARVTLLTLGGTIASTGEGGAAVTPTLSADDLAEVVGLGDVAHLEARELRRVPSGDLTLDDILDVARASAAAFDAGAAGVVVSQGTDTLEETAFALDLLAERGPIVVTGAMRPPASPGADGPANLAAAVRVASSPQSQGLGVLVVMNDEVHAARWVSKTRTTSLGAFASLGVGPIGEVVEGRLALRVRPGAPRGLGAQIVRPFDAVALVTLAMGDDDRLVRALRSLGYSGVVVEAFGGGHVPARMADALGALARDVPVVLASRTGAGTVLTSTYGFPGSESDLIARGLIPAGALDGPKARVLLSVLLATGRNRDRVAEAFGAFDAADGA